MAWDVSTERDTTERDSKTASVLGVVHRRDKTPPAARAKERDSKNERRVRVVQLGRSTCHAISGRGTWLTVETKRPPPCDAMSAVLLTVDGSVYTVGWRLFWTRGRLPAPTKGPMWGYPRGRFWDLGTSLEPFCGKLLPKVDKLVKN